MSDTQKGDTPKKSSGLSWLAWGKTYSQDPLYINVGAVLYVSFLLIGVIAFFFGEELTAADARSFFGGCTYSCIPCWEKE